MTKVLSALLIAVLAAFCFSRVLATADAGEREAMVAIRSHLPGLTYTWSDTVLSEVCNSEYSSTPYVTCEDGHVSGLAFYFYERQQWTQPPKPLGNITGLRFLKSLSLGPEIRVEDLDIWYTQLPNLTSLIFSNWNYDQGSLFSPKFSANFTANPLLAKLTFADYNTSVFPSEIVGAPGLKSLAIMVPKVPSIASNLLARMNLTYLSFNAPGYRTLLREFPDFSHLTYLETLDLSSTSIHELQDNFTSLTHLTALMMDGCTSLTKLAPSLSNCVNLLSLSCNNCKLNRADSLPNFRATQLSHLSLVENSMTIWPDGLCLLPAGASVDEWYRLALFLDYNPLVDPPACFGTVVGLHQASFSLADFTSFPSVFTSMTRLFYLRITDSKKMTGGIPSLSGMTSLDTLELRGCSLTVFPTGLPNNLRHLYLENSHFSGVIPDGIFSGLRWLQVLSIRGNNFTGPFPSSIGGMTNLGHLDADNNAFTTLPDSIGSLTRLWYFSLNNNQLNSIPSDEVWRKMTFMQYLQMKNNRGLNGTLPLFWSEPNSNVFTLDLSGCSFTGNVPSINSTTLTTLILSDNALDGVILPIINGPNLQTFRVDRNALSGSVPESIGSESGPTSLNIFDVSYNRLSGTIPSSFSNTIRTLVEFSFNNNPIEGTLPYLGRSWLSILKGHGTNIRLCDVNPSVQYTDQCSLYDVQDPGSCGCSSWYTRCITNSTCPSPPTEPTPVLPPGNGPRTPPEVHPPVDLVPQPLPPIPLPLASIPAEVVPTLEPLSVPLPLPLHTPTEGSVTVTSATLPASEGVIVVSGNLSINESLTFEGIETSLVVEGCVENIPTQVVIILKGDEKLKTTNLLSQKGVNCSIDLRSISVNLIQDPNPCNQVKSSTKDSTRSSLVVLFDVETTKCNIKWIVLGSALGSVIVLVVVVFIALYHGSPGFRTFAGTCTRKNV